MGPVECAAGGRGERVFAGLAARSGFTEHECAVMARADRLVGVVRVAELRDRQRAQAAGRLSGAQALAQVQQLRERLLDGELQAAGLL